MFVDLLAQQLRGGSPVARFRRFADVVGIFGLMFALLLIPALAHEHREIADGEFSVTIGFINEPAFVNQQNGLYLKVEAAHAEEGATPVVSADGDQHDAGNGFAGLETSLQAEVIYGDQKMALPLTPTDEAGTYESIFFPSAVGDYTFHIFG